MTILDDNKYIAENKYRQYLQNTINQNATWEIEIQLSVAPVSQFGWLIINPDSSSTREEIFYHRKDWNSVFIYDVNRTDAKTHADWSLVVLNNTAWIYNFKEKLNDNIFYHYKISDNDLYIFGWVIVDWLWIKHDIDNFSTDSLSMTNNATNYIYIWTLDDWATYEPLVTTTHSNNIFIIKEVTKDPVWVITSINEWRQFWKWISTNGWMWTPWIDWETWEPWNWISAITLINTSWPIKTYRILFDNASYFDYQIKDWEAVWLPIYTISNDNTLRVINANDITLNTLADTVSTLIKDIKDWLQAIAIDWEDWLDWVSIVSIELLSTVWLVKTYRIYFSNSTTFDYTVSDWENWAWWDMFKSENLSWLSNYITARTNLDVYSISEVDALIPDISWKQDTLVSWTSIKTINWTSVLWTWDITVSWWIKKYCIAWKNVTQSTTSWTTATLTDFVFQTNDTWMSTASNRITITQTWTYLIWWQITYASNSVWTRDLYIRKNWTTLLHSTYIWPNQQAWSYTMVTFSRLEELTVWDYLELRWYQSSWSALDIISSNPYQYTFFYVKEI